MPRADLLALSDDDLAALATRGKVNEARRDLDAGVTGRLRESEDGAVRAEWSDGRVSEVPAGATLRKGRCSCGSVEPCRHLVRLVLLYQRENVIPATASEPWDPGAIPDGELAKHFRPSTLDKVRKTFDAGVLAELVRSPRPVARFHVPACHVRFLVPGDLRYARCDCAKPAPCEHVLLAVWAFRRLEADKRAGIVTAGTAGPPATADLLDAIEEAMRGLAGQGISGADKNTSARLSRLASRCEQADLAWPASIVQELQQQQEAYRDHDARFDPRRVADLAGELLVRLDAIRNDTGAVPQLLVRGTGGDREVKLGYCEFVGLGCGVRVGRKGVEVAAYLYDGKSGAVVALTRQMADGDKPDDELRSFAALGGHVALKGASFADVGTAVVQLQGGRRTAGHELLPGRTGASVLVQDRFSWEEVQPPVLAEEFAELEDRLSGLPPSSLRPRRLTEDFHVLYVKEARAARFDAASHTVQAILVDAAGKRALLEHPYTTRGAAGAEALLARLTAGPGELRFVSGHVRRAMRGLVIHPVCLVWEHGGKRTALQPWVKRGQPASRDGEPAELPRKAEDPLLDYLAQLQDELGELYLLGLARADAMAAGRVRELARRGEAVGFARLAARVAALAEALEQKAHTLRWDARPATEVVLELSALARLAQDVA
jgi:hypothetical protein